MDQIAGKAYHARQANNSRQLDKEVVDTALLDILVRERVLLARPEQEYFFRHEKVQDFFILDHFFKNADLQVEHLEDVRFLGVYLLLADKLEIKDANKLKSHLSLHAAKNQEHSISDAFILKLESLGKLSDLGEN